MKATITGSKASSILFDGKFYDTGKPVDVTFSQAIRMSSHENVSAHYEGVDYDPSLWKNERFINFMGDIDGVSGFGGVSYGLIKYANVKSALTGRVHDVRDLDITKAFAREMNQAGAMVWHDQPRDRWLNTPFRKNIAVIPWETTRIPYSWNSKINNFDALFVPCTANIEMFRDSGIKIPIELIAWGVDEKRYSHIERPQKEMFTFGHMGALSIRKGTDVLIDAFTQAFPHERDVQLICKTSYPNYQFLNNDKRIKIHLTPWTHEEMLEGFFKEIDCFVFPTRGEGFGLTPLEAMATGVPAIVTGWSGPVDYMTPETGWLIDHKMTPATNFTDIVYKEDCGDWAEPSKEHLIQLMRYAYEHRDETRQKGINASEHVAKNWLWSQKIKMYEDALDKHL